VNKYTVIVSPTVADEVHAQALFISRDSVSRAIAWEDRLLAEINAIGELPADAVDPDASARYGSPLRKRVFEKTYLIHYEILEASATINVVNLRHGARLPRRGEP
jgi:plasmid stabilization system protein ParE